MSADVEIIDEMRGWRVYRNGRGEAYTEGGSRYMHGGPTLAESVRRINRRMSIIVGRTWQSLETSRAQMVMIDDELIGVGFWHCGGRRVIRDGRCVNCNDVVEVDRA